MENIDLESIKNIIPNEYKDLFCLISDESFVECFDDMDDALNYQSKLQYPTILYIPTSYVVAK